MQRRIFLKNTALAGSLTLKCPYSLVAGSLSKKNFPVVRVSKGKRNFNSMTIENVIKEFQENIKDKEVGWLSNNCFLNTLDTTVQRRMAGRTPIGRIPFLGNGNGNLNKIPKFLE